MRKKALIIFLICIASFVRLYRFADLTEFLGDQGRDGVVISELQEQKKLPEVGSPLSTGQNTGPFHFYYIAPFFILSGYNPIVPAVALCFLEIASVVLLLVLTTWLFSFEIGYLTSLLYALSPHLIYQDRILWPPTPVPFFTLLAIVSMYLIAKQKKHWALIPFFLANCILIQIHYANSIIVAVSGIFYIWIFNRYIREKKKMGFILWSVLGVLVAILLSWPFLAYEVRHGFSDITSALGTFSSAKGLPFSKRLYATNIVTLMSFVSGYIFPLYWKIPLIFLTVIVCTLGILKKNRWIYFFTAWLLAGIFVLAFYRDTLQPQYAYGLIPLIFLVTAGALAYVRKHISLRLLAIGCTGIMIFMLSQSDIFSPGNRDIARVQALTDTMIQRSNGQPFSFTLISTRSYSDFHYRFYFKRKQISPVVIDSPEYKRLFLVCESGKCPTIEEIHMNQRVYTICYDKMCKFDYPIIDIWKWNYENKVAVGSSVIYEYTR